MNKKGGGRGVSCHVLHRVPFSLFTFNCELAFSKQNEVTPTELIII